MATTGDSELDELLRAEGRRQADNALNWDTTCIGCAGRLDRLYAERWEGAKDACRAIAAALRAAYAETGDHSLMQAVTIVQAYATQAAQGDVERPDGPDEGHGHPGSPDGIESAASRPPD